MRSQSPSELIVLEVQTAMGPYYTCVHRVSDIQAALDRIRRTGRTLIHTNCTRHSASLRADGIHWTKKEVFVWP